MTIAPVDVLSPLRRTNFPYFLIKVFETLHPGAPPLELAWYLQAICHALAPTNAGAVKRLVVTVPPRHLKSITVSVAFVAWQLGHDPSMKIMVASYSRELARLHAKHTGTIMQSDWYRRDFPGTCIAASRALEIETTAGGIRKAVSVGGSITGFGADIIIVDDCMKADAARSPVMRAEVRDWFDHTLLSRLNDKATGVIISIQQRLHEDDLAAYMLDSHLNLPAIAEKEHWIAVGPDEMHHRAVGDLLNPAREDRATLDQLRRDLGPVAFSAQYQQAPVAPEGNMIRMEWFGTYDEAPGRHEFLKVVQSWDTGMTDAPTSDFSVCTTWGFERAHCKWYLLDVFRHRLAYPDLKQAVIRLRRQFKADNVIIEQAGSGYSLHQDLRAAGPFLPVLIRPATSKEERFNGCLGEVEAGHILLPADAPWLDAFCGELRAFPSGRHDDQADSFSQFVNWQLRNWKYILTERGPNGRVRNLVRHRGRPW